MDIDFVIFSRFFLIIIWKITQILIRYSKNVADLIVIEYAPLLAHLNNF